MTPVEERNISYTVGSIESQVRALGEQMREGFKRLEEKIDGEVKELREENKTLNKRVSNLEDTVSKFKAQVAVLVFIVSGVLFFIGDAIKDWLF